jgi:hypothetical protein
VLFRAQNTNRFLDGFTASAQRAGLLKLGDAIKRLEIEYDPKHTGGYYLFIHIKIASDVGNSNKVCKDTTEYKSPYTPLNSGNTWSITAWN